MAPEVETAPETESAPRWLQIRIATFAHDALEDRLLEAGALAVTLSDAADTPVFEPAPGEVRTWPETVVTGLFELDTDLPALATELIAEGLCLAEHLHIDGLPDRAWEREWLKDFKPMQFGQRLWVSPHEAQQVWPDDAVVLRMDPGLAFGTGTHPTTRLCLAWLDQAYLAGKTVIDYGCGSGVLAVAAALLGAEKVIVYDIDPQAMTATRSNAQANAVEHKLEFCQIDEPPHEAVDIVLANILAGTLIQLQAELSALVVENGELIMSGILAEQAQNVVNHFAEQFLLTPANSEAWVRLDGRRFARPN